MKNTLTQAVEDLSLPRLSASKLWRQGRRLRRRRRLQDTASGLLAVLIAAIYLWVPGTSSQVAAPPESTVVIPQTVASPHIWERLHAESPNGPIIAMFAAPSSNLVDNLFGGRTSVLLGRNGTYRLRNGWPPVLLSPDGRHAAQKGGVVIDLATTLESVLPAGKVLAWTRDSSALLTAGEQGLLWHHWRSGQQRVLGRAKNVEAAAFSADGRKLAYTVRTSATRG